MPILSNISLLRNRILPHFSQRMFYSSITKKKGSNQLSDSKIAEMAEREATKYSSSGYPPTELSPVQAAGKITSSYSNFSHVIVESTGEKIGVQLLCTTRPLLNKIKVTAMVGDKVLVDAIDWVERKGIIFWVYERDSKIGDPPVANVNHLLVFFSIDQPLLNPFSLTRFLIDTESSGISFTLALNKLEIVDEETIAHWKSTIVSWGYDPVFCSVATSYGLDTLLSRLKDKTSVIVGPSGSGKSSLINALRKNSKEVVITQNNKSFEGQRVGEVSVKSGHGKHTTRNVSLLPLSEGGYVADTPGFNKPKLKQINQKQLQHHFPEIREIWKERKCLIPDCYHMGEPGCVVNGDWQRYGYYLSLLDEIVKREGLVTGVKIFDGKHYKTLLIRDDTDFKKSAECNKYRILAKKERGPSIFDPIEYFVRKGTR